MILRIYSEIFVEIQVSFPEILRFEFVTLFVKHPVLRYDSDLHPLEMDMNFFILYYVIYL